MPKGYIQLLFNEKPANTTYTAGSYCWVLESEAAQYIANGMAVEYGKESDLPKDMPGREALIKAGVKSIEEVMQIEDFDEIEGIGQSTEKKILEYLDGR